MGTDVSRRYQPLFDLAAGGMGVVSVAQLRGDRGFRKTVALKRIAPQLASDPVFYELLAKEAHVASLIRDPGVVQVHELVEEGDELVLAMELVEGVSLKRVQTALDARGARFPVPVAVRILAKVARALHAAHTATDDGGRPLGVVHRDVSPQNVLLSFRGEVKVTDFGIAKALEGDESSRSSTVRGKPAYLSPEQASGGVVDLRSDLWSLGVVAFELLAGRRLFKGRNDLETLRLLLEGEIPYLDAEREDVPSALAAVVHRALAREPGARWTSALELARALEASVGGRFARRDDVAALLAEHLPGEEAGYHERLRAALSASADSGGSDAAASSSRAPRIAPRPLRFAGWMAAAFAVTLVARLYLLEPGRGPTVRPAPSTRAVPAAAARPDEPAAVAAPAAEEQAARRTAAPERAPGEAPTEHDSAEATGTTSAPAGAEPRSAGSEPDPPASARLHDRHDRREEPRSGAARAGPERRGQPERPSATPPPARKNRPAYIEEFPL